MSEIRNARVRSTYLGMEDHGIPTFNVDLQYEGNIFQGFGGFDLRHYGIKPIMRILATLEVPSWEKLPGSFCRVRVESGLVCAIGHFFENRWYEVQKEGAVLE